MRNVCSISTPILMLIASVTTVSGDDPIRNQNIRIEWRAVEGESPLKIDFFGEFQVDADSLEIGVGDDAIRIKGGADGARFATGDVHGTFTSLSYHPRQSRFGDAGLLSTHSGKMHIQGKGEIAIATWGNVAFEFRRMQFSSFSRAGVIRSELLARDGAVEFVTGGLRTRIKECDLVLDKRTIRIPVRKSTDPIPE